MTTNREQKSPDTTIGTTFIVAWFLSSFITAVTLIDEPEGSENIGWLVLAMLAWWGLGAIIGWLIDTVDEGWRHK